MHDKQTDIVSTGADLAVLVENVCVGSSKSKKRQEMHGRDAKKESCLFVLTRNVSQNRTERQIYR